MEAKAPHSLPLCGHHFLRHEKIVLKMRPHADLHRVDLLGLFRVHVNLCSLNQLGDSIMTVGRVVFSRAKVKGCHL